MPRRRSSTPVTFTDVDLSTVEVGTPVRIEWIDAHHVSSIWCQPSSITDEPCRVLSVGMFVRVTDTEVFYAADLAEDGPEPHLNAVSAIPLGCVQTIELLSRTNG